MSAPAVLADVRRVRPPRRLSLYEARRIAEVQANKLLRLQGLHSAADAPVPEEVIAHLPHIQVTRLDGMTTSAFAHWEHGRWHIVLNADHARVRQRYSLCHEAHHVIEHPFARFEPDEARAELLADWFSACLLMPKTWVKTLWADGIQDTVALARRFNVSRIAMRRRLEELRLIEPTSGRSRRPYLSRSQR
jgi:Zn-dependent peptidase ImmA (M78 family)